MTRMMPRQAIETSVSFSEIMMLSLIPMTYLFLLASADGTTLTAPIAEKASKRLRKTSDGVGRGDSDGISSGCNGRGTNRNGADNCRTAA
jgi:hypothetical protein